MKLKSYYMQDQSQPLGCLMEQQENQPQKRKVKYQSKTKGYSEDQDFLYYNSQQDEQEALGVTLAKYTLESSYESY